MTAIAVVRQAIAARLAGVPDIGRVHATRRDAKSAAEIKADFIADDAGVRAWIIAHQSLAETADTVGIATETMIWTIDGFVAFGDGGGEAILDTLIDAIRAAFSDTDLGLPGLVVGGDDQSGIAVTDRQPVLLGRAGGVVCATARLTLTTTIN